MKYTDTKNMISKALENNSIPSYEKLISSEQSFTPFFYTIVQMMKPEKVFEWGMGQSTSVWLFSDPNVLVTVHEEHQMWADKFLKLIKEKDPQWLNRLDARVWPHNPALAKEYMNPTDPDETYDIVLVDGGGRANCMPQAERIVKKGGVIFAHDTQYPNYFDSLNGALNPDIVDFVGTHTRNRCDTSIWVRKDN